MAGIQNGPIPTRLTLLSDLGKFSPGEKVRFLGWYVSFLCVIYCSTKGLNIFLG
jgi:hypothetical protein